MMVRKIDSPEATGVGDGIDVIAGKVDADEVDMIEESGTDTLAAVFVRWDELLE